MKNKTLFLILLTMLMAPLASKAQETCAAPTGLRLSSVGPYTANLFWDDEDEPYFKYVLMEGHNISPTTVSFSDAEVINGHGNYSFWQLAPSTDYTFFLFKVCDVNIHSQPASVEFHTPSCASPEGLRLGDVGPYSANLLWTHEDGVVFKYVLESGHHLNLAEVDFSHPDNITTPGNYAFSNLHPNTDYTFFLLKTCSGGDYSPASIEFRTGPSCLPPTGLRLQEGSLTAYSANIHWDAEENDHFSYAVVRGHNIDPETVTNYRETTLNNQGVTGLDPDTDYTFFLIRRCSASDHSEPAYIEFHTLPSCLPPTGLRVQEGSPTAYAVNLLWNDEDGVGFKYILERTAYINEHPEYVNVSNASTTPYTGNFSYTYLTPDTDYTFFLFKICSGSDHSQPASVEFHTLESCPALTGLQVVEGSVGAHTATVEWDFVEGVEFLYTWRQGNNTDPTGVAFNGGGYIHTKTLTDLEADTDYTFFLKKNCGSNGNNDYSSVVAIVFHTEESCPAPTGLQVVEGSIGAHTATVEWDFIEGVTFLYNWRQGNNTDPTGVAFTWGGFVGTHTITGLTADTDYTFFLKKNCGSNGTNDYSDIVSVVFHTAAPCPTPTFLHVVTNSLTPTGVTMAWDGEEGALFLYTWMEGTNIDPQTVAFLWGGYVNTHTIDDLTPDTDYTFFLRRACANDEYSDIVSLEFHTPCPAPTNLAATNLTSHSATLSWTGTSETYIVEQANGYPTTSRILNEGFESGSMPTGWTTNPSNPYYDWEVGAGLGSNDYPIDPASGNYNVYFQPSQQYYLYSVLISPPMDLSEAIDATLSFKYINPAWGIAQNELWIKYRVNGGDWQYLASYTSDQETWTSINGIALPNLGANYQIGFFGFNDEHDDFGYGIGLDDISVQATTYTYRWVTVSSNATSPYTLNVLRPETTYRVRVSSCFNGEASEPIEFTTTSTCPAPDNLSVNNITKNSATVSWEGTTNTYSSYNVMYREVIPGDLHQVFFDSFEGDFSAWTTYALDYSSDVTNWQKFDMTDWNDDYHGHTGDNVARSQSYNRTDGDVSVDNWLVSPRMTLGDVVKFWVTGGGYAPGQGEVRDYYEVRVSTGTNAVSDFVFVAAPDYAPGYQIWAERTVLLGNYAGQQGYVAIRHHDYGQDYICVDDFGVYNNTCSYGTVHTLTTTTNSCELTGLTPGTLYEVQVQGIDCNGNGGLSEWSTLVNFTTLTGGNKEFTNATNDGYWGTANNWTPSGAPTLSDDVILSANVTIESGCEAEADIITQNNYSITIADGGQLKHNNDGVVATVKKNFTGYGAGNENNRTGYYLIATPVTESLTSQQLTAMGLTPYGNVTGAHYDLYAWDGSQTNEEWQNWENTQNENHHFPLAHYNGYLYANQDNVEVSFTGTLESSAYEIGCEVQYHGDGFASLSLWGNPFVCNVYLSSNMEAMAFYRMNVDGNRFIAATGAIKPMEGFFVQAVDYEAPQLFTINRTQPNSSKNINMSLNQGEGLRDRAIVRFDNGNTLEKFSFSNHTAKLYIPQGSKDYAVVRSNGQGEMPVNFKAAENGTYTISVEPENVEVTYLHLIDNRTGANVDLLANPSYTFNANKGDNANRFRLVFKANTDVEDNTATETFAYFNGSEWVISNMGDATLQVIDMMGRVLRSEQINGNTAVNINETAGIYMLRLVNGENVMVQKVVVR